MNPKYCPKHKYINPKCLACMTRYASALGTRNVLLEAVARSADKLLAKMGTPSAPIASVYDDEFLELEMTVAALGEATRERGGV